MSSTPLRQSDLIFPTASKALHATLTELKRSNLSITNRLKSITHDADFVSKIGSTYQLPLIANERCGSWYIPPDLKAGSVYFKSTDGHAGQWGLNLRRLNLHVLDVIGQAGGCIVVDSTRRGKSMPDALSKTVPIWICALNRYLFPEIADAHEFKTPVDVISRSEHAQIEERMDMFVENLRELGLDADALRRRLDAKPLEPFWVTQELQRPIELPKNPDRNPVVLCTASGRTTSIASASYVQGAADDSESWACGLSAAAFWTHKSLLLSTLEEDLTEVIEGLKDDSNSASATASPVAIKSTNVSIGNNSNAKSTLIDFDFIVSCSEEPDPALVTKLRDRYLHLACNSGKVGSRQLRQQLPKVNAVIGASAKERKILITCHTGRDLAVGVAVAVVCLSLQQKGIEINKLVIKQQLSSIMLSMPNAAPSRATLQSVNSFLLGQHSSSAP